MKLFSNEIVFRGHPDKACDQISDAILDEYLRKDKNSRCAIEVCGGKRIIFITGEVTSNAKINIKKIVKKVLLDIGYDTNYKIINNIGVQSSDINLGTNTKIGGAGDQGMMFGYAVNDNKYFLPTAQVILSKLSIMYDNLIRNDKRFLPDGKAQITGNYDENMNLKYIDTFLVSYQNTEENRKETDKIIIEMINSICKEFNIEVKNILLNPTGRFRIGGFQGDAGLTGRKIVVDSYQGFASVGGGAFSGKDPSKVDRSGAYKARLIAIDYLKKYNLKWCQVQLSYAIGIRKPLAIYITSDKGDIEVEKKLYKECEPNNIIKDLNLLNECYYDRCKYGHFITKNI